MVWSSRATCPRIPYTYHSLFGSIWPWKILYYYITAVLQDIFECVFTESNAANQIYTYYVQEGTLSVPTFLSPHVSQFPRFHMSGQTTWQITYESLLGKMLRLRNSCLWICSVTNKQTWGTPDSDYISNSQERKSHTENKRKKKMGWPPHLP